jgi:hypothetical protein
MSEPEEQMESIRFILFILAIFAIGFCIGWWVHPVETITVPYNENKVVYVNQTVNETCPVIYAHAYRYINLNETEELPTIEPTELPTIEPTPEPTHEPDPDPAPDPTPIPKPTTMPVSEFPFLKEILK